MDQCAAVEDTPSHSGRLTRRCERCGLPTVNRNYTCTSALQAFVATVNCCTLKRPHHNPNCCMIRPLHRSPYFIQPLYCCPCYRVMWHGHVRTNHRVWLPVGLQAVHRAPPGAAPAQSPSLAYHRRRSLASMQARAAGCHCLPFQTATGASPASVGVHKTSLDQQVLCMC